MIQGNKLEFSGEGAKYFGIWAVNTILTILTLGLYYPWAKTSVRKYLWNETKMDGDSFVYHGTGKEMFKGFIKVYAFIIGLYAMIMIFVSININTSLILLFNLLFYVCIILLIPFAIFGAWKYRLSRTSWRGIFFSFRGKMGDFLKVYFKNFFLVIITFGIYFPWMRVNISKYLLKHSQFGQYKLGFQGEGGEFFMINLAGAFLSAITLYIYLPWFMTNMFNFAINNIEIEQDGEKTYPLQSSLEGGNAFFVLFTNGLLLIFTLGIAFPWTKMRLQKLFTENIIVREKLNLAGLRQDAENYGDATGDDLLDVLDLDLG